jgi:SAM-dependent methyltransferase
VDLGSIVSIADFTWSAYDEFCRFCLHPLILMAHGEDQIARLLMCEDSGVMESDISKLMGDTVLPGSRPHRSTVYRLESIVRQHVPLSYRTWLKQKLSATQRLSRGRAKDQKSSSDPLQEIREKSHVDFLVKIRGEVESVSLPHTKPKSYHRAETSHLSLSEQEGWTAKQKNIRQVLTDLKPSSVMDIGSGTGWYSKLAALLGSRVVAWDIDPMCTTQLYLDVLDMKLPILPLIMDFSKPTPSRGLANHWAVAATDRFQCDMVIALGLVHQLVHKSHLNFEQIVGGLAALSKKWVVLEFIPAEDQEVRPLQSTGISWYTLDSCVTALNKHFSRVRIMPSYPKPRLLLLCEKL